MRTEPPVSVPSPAGAMRAPIATPVPDEEPPAMRDASQALRTPTFGPALKAGL